MNIFIITGIILIALGTLLTTYGGIINSKHDKEEIITTVVENAEKNSRAEVILDSVSINKERKKIMFNIKNYGNSTAKDINLNLGFSTPAGGDQEGNHIGLKELPKEKADTLEHDLFPFYNLPSFKEDFEKFFNEFNSGDRTLIIHANLKYKSDDGLYSTGDYSISYHNDGSVHFFKL